MANLNTQSFSSIISNFATAVQGSAAQLVDFTIGSVLRAISEAMGGVALWLQGLALQVAALTRAATSNGPDLDSWFAQFGFSRLPANAATTQETFSRFTPTNQAPIPIGAIVQTQDGTIIFAVVADSTNPAFDPTQNAYVLPAGQASLSVAVQCSTAGTIGNVSAGQLNTLGTAIAGIDFVSNGAAVTNGESAESDAAARARFVLFIASLEAATLLAVRNAIASVQQGLTDTIAENEQYNGQRQDGMFTVIVDDGTGHPSETLLANVANAIERVRPLCSTYGVHGPVVVTVTVSMTIVTAAGTVHADVAAAVRTAIINYINGLVTTDDGVTLPWAILSAIAFGVSGVTNVSGVLLNGGTDDLSANSRQSFEAGSVTVL